MTYFHFYPHCYLISGNVNAAVYDLFQTRVLWLNEKPIQDVAKALESGVSLEEACEKFHADKARMKNHLDILEMLDYGSYEDRPVYAEKFRPFMLSKQEEELFIHRPLSRITMEIASQCTLNCTVCPSKHGIGTSACSCGVWSSGTETLSYNIAKLLTDVKTNGCKNVFIQGGAPFLEKQVLYEIIARAFSCGLDVSVQTPGIALSDDDCGFLAKHNVNMVVPIFGYSEDAYESVTRVRGSFLAMESLLKKYAEGQLPRLTCRIIVGKDSFADNDRILEYLKTYGINATIRTESFLPSDSIPFDPAFLAGSDGMNLHKTSFKDFRAPMEVFFRLAKGHLCWQDQLAISRSGDILPCIAARNHVLGNAATDSILEILRCKNNYHFRNASNDLIEPCSKCEFRYGCISCSVISERVHGQLRGKSWDCRYDPLSGQW